MGEQRKPLVTTSPLHFHQAFPFDGNRNVSPDLMWVTNFWERPRGTVDALLKD
jgi:hypothetical protein